MWSQNWQLILDFQDGSFLRAFRSTLQGQPVPLQSPGLPYVNES